MKRLTAVSVASMARRLHYCWVLATDVAEGRERDMYIGIGVGTLILIILLVLFVF